MISVEDSIEAVTAGFEPVAGERIALPECLGRVLAENVAARVSHPPSAVSSMDGYAVRAADVRTVPVTLGLIGEAGAGRGFAGTVGAGETVRIFTGAPLPNGADAVVIQEDAEAVGASVTMRETTAPGRNVRPAGLDFGAGDVLLRAGRVLTARDLGLAAAMNVPWMHVRRRPRIVFVATGDEVVMPGDPLGPNQIVSSNSVALAAYIRVLGGMPIDLGTARDDPASLLATLAGAKGADLLVTTGGVSVGDYDLVSRVLGAEGLELAFHRVAMRPGKPLLFGRVRGVPVLGLPGNPVSTGVTAVIFLKAAMEVMLGIEPRGRRVAHAVLGRDLGANDLRQDYLRSALDTGPNGEMVATPFDRQDSSMMARFAAADCLVVRPPHAAAAERGDRVDVIMLTEGMTSF